MTRALLDINVLLALLDSDHADHERAQEWARDHLVGGWATCPITENGFVRIISQPRYPSSVAPSTAVGVLRAACRTGDHAFWPCDVSLLDPDVIADDRVHGPRQVTDAYLLALAVAHRGRFATFDRSVALSAVRGAEEQHLVLV